MKTNNKERLFEMMGRLDPSFKRRLVENHILSLNEERTVYTNMLQMFQENNLRPGSFVAIGYVNSVEIPKRIFPTERNEQYARDLIAAADEHGLNDYEINLLHEFIGNELWAKTKAGEIIVKGKKHAKQYFDRNVDVPIVTFDRFILNFMDKKGLGKNFADQSQGIEDKRRQYGFGKEEDQYPEDDWRRRAGARGREFAYGGLGIKPVVDPRDVNKGSTYKQHMGDFPLYGDIDKEGNPRMDDKTGLQRVALRQNISTNLIKKDTDYFLVDGEGNLKPLSYKFINFVSKYVKQAKSELDDLRDDEKEYIAAVKDIEGKYATMQFITNKTAFITATVEDDKTKEPKPVYFYNEDIDIFQEFPINKQQLVDHVGKYMKDSFKMAKEKTFSER
jgi:hypothetical protein